MTILLAPFTILDGTATAPFAPLTATTVSLGWTEQRCHHTGRCADRTARTDHRTARACHCTTRSPDRTARTPDRTARRTDRDISQR